MHLVCLGVTRPSSSFGGVCCRIGSKTIDTISSNLIALRGFIAKEFARKPRSLCETDGWKATEFRQFLLYTGPVVLLGNVSDAVMVRIV